MGLFVAKKSTGDQFPRSDQNEDQDDVDMTAFGKRPQLKVGYSTFRNGQRAHRSNADSMYSANSASYL